MPTSLRPAVTFLLALAATTWLAAQGLTDARKLYDAGKYQDAIDSAKAAGPSPRLLFLQAQAHERLGEADEAAAAYARLGETDKPVWTSIAQSAAAVRDKEAPQAIDAATKATTQDAGVAEAHYQLGAAYILAQNFAQAAKAFDKAAEIDPQWAYARYYAGLSHYKAKRVDLLASRWDAFLKLAPNAPERPEVESIMKTLRGRGSRR